MKLFVKMSAFTLQLYTSEKYTVDQIYVIMGCTSRKTFYNIKDEAAANAKDK